MTSLRVAFRYRLLVPPVVAVVALAAAALVARGLANRAEALTEAVQTAHVPALQAARDLEDVLGKVQAKLEEAVGTEDAEQLAAANQLAATFDSTAATLRRNGAADAREIEALVRAFDTYYALARETSARLLRRERGEAVTDALRLMTARYTGTRELLSAATRGARARMEEAFRTARELQQTSVRVMVFTIAGAIVLLGWMVAGMILRLRAMNTTLNDTSVRLTTSASTLSELTESSAVLLRNQAAELDAARETTRSVAESSGVAARQAEAVLEVARRATEFSSSGIESARQGLTGIDKLRTQVESIVETSTGLAEKARQVSEISASVQEIAHQSNLLSLNALIEAARAGAAGASFAIVAREVRALAERSRNDAERIAAIIADIEAAIRSTAETTQLGRSGLEQSLRDVTACSESLRQLGKITEETSAAAMEIASAVKQQSTSIAQITGAVTSIDSGMDQTVRGMADVATAAADLRGTSDRISALVSEFRI